MAETGQQVDVRSPGADAVQGCESGMRFIRRYVHELFQMDLTLADRAGDGFERANLRTRQAEPPEPHRACARNRGRLERIECRRQPSPNRAGARGRKLLRHYNGGKPRIAVGAPPQWRPAGLCDDRHKAWIDRAKRGKAGVEIGLGVNMR